MSDYGRSHELPGYLREWQEKIEGKARDLRGSISFPRSSRS